MKENGMCCLNNGIRHLLLFLPWIDCCVSAPFTSCTHLAPALRLCTSRARTLSTGRVSLVDAVWHTAQGGTLSLAVVELWCAAL